MVIKRKFSLSFIVVSLILISILSGCSENTKSEKVPREVTSQEAQLFSQILKRNLDEKTAAFEIAPSSNSGASFSAQGKVDWQNSVVSLQATLNSSGQIDIESISSTSEVFENYLGLESLQENAGLNPKKWIKRPVDSSKFGVDAISQYVLSLSASLPDNPLLIKQDGAQFLGEQKINEEKVSIFKKKEGGTLYYVSKTGLLIGVSVKIEGFTTEMLVLFKDHGISGPSIPTSEKFYDLSEVQDFYFLNRPAF